MKSPSKGMLLGGNGVRENRGWGADIDHSGSKSPCGEEIGIGLRLVNARLPHAFIRLYSLFVTDRPSELDQTVDVDIRVASTMSVLKRCEGLKPDQT